jgi:hypothetical protein
MNNYQPKRTCPGIGVSKLTGYRLADHNSILGLGTNSFHYLYTASDPFSLLHNDYPGLRDGTAEE